MNAWLQQVRAEGLRIVYVTMGNWAQGKRVTVLGKLSDANCVSAPSWSPIFFDHQNVGFNATCSRILLRSGPSEIRKRTTDVF